MKLRIKYQGAAKVISVDVAINVSELKHRIAQEFGLQLRDFFISLNNNDNLGVQHAATKSAKDAGIVSGDTIYAMPGEDMYLTEQPQAPSSSSSSIPSTSAGSEPYVGAIAVAVPSPAAAPTSSRATATLDETISQLAEHVNDLDTTVGSLPEVAIVLIHCMLCQRRFEVYPSEDGKRLPVSWKDTAAAGFYRLQYKHPSSNVTLEVTFTVAALGTIILCNGICKVQDTTKSTSCQLIISDHFKQPEISQLEERNDICSLFKSFSSTCAWLMENFVEPVCHEVIGHSAPLVRLPDDLKRRIFKAIDVKWALNAGKSCRPLHDYVQKDERLWKHYLVRDFGAQAVEEADTAFDESYKQCYMARFEDAKRQREREQNERMQRARNRLEDNRNPFPRYPFEPGSGMGTSDTRPPRFMPGMIGGPDDLNPLSGHVRFPNVLNPELNVPGAPGGLRPRGPRFYPVQPDDPDAGLQPNPEGPRRNPRRPPRHNPDLDPFGGGPDFPGFL